MLSSSHGFNYLNFDPIVTQVTPSSGIKRIVQVNFYYGLIASKNCANNAIRLLETQQNEAVRICLKKGFKRF